VDPGLIRGICASSQKDLARDIFQLMNNRRATQWPLLVGGMMGEEFGQMVTVNLAGTSFRDQV